jgi:hypothetical protein
MCTGEVRFPDYQEACLSALMDRAPGCPSVWGALQSASFHDRHFMKLL